MLDQLQYRMLRRLYATGESGACDGSAYAGKSKLRVLLGDQLLGEIAGRTVVDFGCGDGSEAIELAQAGAAKVIGVDIRPEVLVKARQRAETAGVAGKCEFTASPTEAADIVVSIDTFEHFDDPAAILQVMHSLLRPGGEVFASFGPTWYHPLGGHLFSVFPWSHLVFSEKALIRWRSDFKKDAATRFSEVAGGLNQMTIARFERIIASSPFDCLALEPLPIRKFQRIHAGWNREFTTALVRCRLRKKASTPHASAADVA